MFKKYFKKYIGVTGITREDELRELAHIFPREGEGALAPAFMAGVLVTQETLRGKRPKHPGRYPPLERLIEIFVRPSLIGCRLLQTFHYFSHARGNDLLIELLALSRLAPDFALHGIQLNMDWPEPSTLEKFHIATSFNHSIVLRLSRQALYDIHPHSPDFIVRRLEHYNQLVDAVLFDLSGGQGQGPTQEEKYVLHQHIREWHSYLPFSLGVAGGLTSQSLDWVIPMLHSYPYLSTDAEGGLRDTEDNLDIDKAADYISDMLNLHGYAPVKQP